MNKKLKKNIIFGVAFFSINMINFKIAFAETEYKIWSKSFSDVSLDKKWTIQFNQPANWSSIKEDNIKILDKNNKNLKVEVIYDAANNAAIVTPIEKYSLNERYSLVITDNVLSSKGKNLKPPIKMDFMTFSGINDVMAKGNIQNGGYIAQDGNRIYYFSNSGTLKSMSLDGSDDKTIFSEKAEYINVDGNYVYYSNGLGIQRVDKDGTNRKTILQEQVSSMTVSGDWVYYKLTSDSNLYKIKSDGTFKTVLVNEAVKDEFAVDSEYIYYSNGNGFFALNIDGSSKVKFSNKPFNTIVLNEKDIYYSDVDGIHKFTKEGSKETIFNEAINYFNISDNVIYYSTNSGTFRMNMNGSEKQNISSLKGKINMAGDWIYSYNDSDGKLYRYKINGTLLEVVK